MKPHVPEGYQVVLVEEDSRVRIYHMGREIVSARIEQLAAFYCWLSAERNALAEASLTKSAEGGK